MKDEFADPPPIEINGKSYPLWSQFVQRKAEWIGGVLEDFGDAADRHIFRFKAISQEISDINLKPNGNDSAFFEVRGERFCCGFDVAFGGIVGGDEGWITFSGYGGHIWRIKKPGKNSPKPEAPPQLHLT